MTRANTGTALNRFMDLRIHDNSNTVIRRLTRSRSKKTLDVISSNGSMSESPAERRLVVK